MSLGKAGEARVHDYSIVIAPLSAEDGGGYLATVPDLPGCMSDGASREEAARKNRGRHPTKKQPGRSRSTAAPIG